MDDINNSDLQKEKIESLLVEFGSHRDAIKDMIVDLEKMREKIDTLIPENLDARYMRFFEEKVKTITQFFNSLLEMRKEIAKSAKDEIDIRRRMKDKNLDVVLEDLLDVRSMVEHVDSFKEEVKKIKDKRKNKTSLLKHDKSIVIPGMNDKGDA